MVRKNQNNRVFVKKVLFSALLKSISNYRYRKDILCFSMRFREYEWEIT